MAEFLDLVAGDVRDAVIDPVLDASENRLHTPVMGERIVELLAPALVAPGAVCVDATLGLGGHTELLLRAFPELTVIGLDRDPAALQAASARLEEFGERFVPVHTVFDGLGTVLEAQGIASVQGILFDLGVSSMQLDFADRGFAYAVDAPLDMRMDQSEGRTAADIVNTESAAELARIFKVYGDEPLAARYASAITKARDAAPIESSGELVDILQDATPYSVKNKRHPAKRVFQALRVVVNNELEAIDNAIPQALGALAVDGRLVVMSYQSHEDKRIKQFFADATQHKAPEKLPQVPDTMQPEFRLLTRGAEVASEAEQQANPRAIPARVRAVTRVRENNV